MVEEGHQLFRQWAKYEKIYVGGVYLGYGGTVTAKIMDGKGTILPGAPPGSGRPRVYIDEVGIWVGRFVAHCGDLDREVIKHYYLVEGYTVDEKAAMLKLSNRELYRRLHRLQLDLVCSRPNLEEK